MVPVMETERQQEEEKREVDIDDRLFNEPLREKWSSEGNLPCDNAGNDLRKGVGEVLRDKV